MLLLSLTNQLLRHNSLFPECEHLNIGIEQKERSPTPTEGSVWKKSAEENLDQATARLEEGEEEGASCCEFPSLLKLGKPRKQKEKRRRETNLRLRGQLVRENGHLPPPCHHPPTAR